MGDEKAKWLKFKDEPNWVYLFLAWSFASILGFFLNNAIQLDTRLLNLVIDLSGNNSDNFYFFFGLLLSGIKYGIIFGLFQSIILSFYVNKSVYWFFATLAGYILKELTRYTYIFESCCTKGNEFGFLSDLSANPLEYPKLAMAIGSINDPPYIIIQIISWIILAILQWIVLRKWVENSYLWVIFIPVLELVKTFFTPMIHLCNSEIFTALLTSFILIALLRHTWLKTNIEKPANPRST
jgi:hypothetical protein